MMNHASAAGASQSLTWGEIDGYTLLPLGNGDIAGTFDPFAGTTYDELRHGSGAQRDIRTLLVSRLFAQDYSSRLSVRLNIFGSRPWSTESTT